MFTLWETCIVPFYSEKKDVLLAEGWEPFAATAVVENGFLSPLRQHVLYLRRPIKLKSTEHDNFSTSDIKKKECP